VVRIASSFPRVRHLVLGRAARTSFPAWFVWSLPIRASGLSVPVLSHPHIFAGGDFSCPEIRSLHQSFVAQSQFFGPRISALKSLFVWFLGGIVFESSI
jgi:hypothetical protein